jgi:hypothetical protein
MFLVVAMALAFATGGATWWLLGRPASPGEASAARLPTARFPAGQPLAIKAEEITEGKLAMERLPPELTGALEAQSAEIVKNAEIIASKQARVTGTCAPGSAIRVIGEDGSVSCQRLPRGVISVSSLGAVPRLSGTGTAQGSVPGGVGRYQTRDEDDFLVVGVPLPDGAQVSSFTYRYYDAHPEVDGVAYLYRSDDEVMAAAPTAGAEQRVREATTEEIQLRRVDAAKFAYFVFFMVSAEAGANLVPISASVEYRLP